ncbi:NADH:flavin oxidoreductase [Cupriavidus respiraculi]|uniref:NADH:flavin oxidoreductase n=1 Tax=Cupriavidus respiraculi TaxID=195930 RepID=UPI001C9429F4|nr:NADH:flavin oxidoreductase [Cupriavidus respiraculi]MBY4949293.1 NADH:flavin oxidoreductase [Cupriavidus respiraculi]
MTRPALPDLPGLLAPFRLGPLTLPNRLAVAPMTRISATDDGVPTAAMARYYARFARGGFGLVITEGVYTDRAYAQGYANQPGLTDMAQALAWRDVVRAVHAGGGRIVAQLMHAGALSQANRFRGDTVGPSAVRPAGEQMRVYAGTGPYRMPRAMTEAEIGDAVAGFARAATLAREVAGFDAVEIHGANGYLLDQFLTGHTNQRIDGWGGDIRHRVRLAVETAHAVRAAVGAGFPLGIRISQGKVNDFHHKWPEAAQGAATVFGALAGAGVDYLHVTEFEAWRPAFPGDPSSLVEHARRAAPGLPIVANGGLHDTARALEVLRQGANLVALGRGALANPDFPGRLAAALQPRPFDPALLSPLGNLKPGEVTEEEHAGRVMAQPAAG